MILYLPGVKPQAGQLKLAGDLVNIGPTVLELLGKQGGDKVAGGLFLLDSCLIGSRHRRHRRLDSL